MSDITLADSPYVIGMGRFVDFNQADDFVGKAALQKIAAEGAKRRLVGIEIGGDALLTAQRRILGHVGWWQEMGHVTRCAHSPRLDKNIGWANVAAEFFEIGTELTVDSPNGVRKAIVCEAPWFKPQIRIPDEMKA